MKKFENPSLPAPIYIYADIFYTPCLPYHYFRLENIDDLKARLKIDDDLMKHIVNAYHKNKTLLPNEGEGFIADVRNHDMVCIDPKGYLYTVNTNYDTYLALLAYGNKNQGTLQNIAKLEINPIDLALAERDDLSINVLITFLNKGNMSANTILLKKGRYNDDETLLSLINTGSPRIIEAIAGKEDISPTIFQALERYYHYERVPNKLIENENLPEYMLADIVQLENLSSLSKLQVLFHPQYRQYMNEYFHFGKIDINSDKFDEKVETFFNHNSGIILPIYQANNNLA